MNELTVPAHPSPESVRVLARAAGMRRVMEKSQATRLSALGSRLIMGAVAATVRRPEGTRVRRVRGGRLVTGRDADPANGILLWVHGGGFLSGGPKLEQHVAAGYAVDARIPAFLPKYPRPPEHPFPAAADTLLAAYESLLRQGFSPDAIRIGGLSSGGALAAGLLVDIVRTGLPMPRSALLLSPVLQLSGAAAALRDQHQPDPMIPPVYVRRMARAYAGDTPLTDPRLDYLGSDLSSWPPVLVQVGGTECLGADAELLATALRAAGRECEVQVWPGQVHGWPLTGLRKVPEARQALTEGARFIAR